MASSLRRGLAAGVLITGFAWVLCAPQGSLAQSPEIQRSRVAGEEGFPQVGGENPAQPGAGSLTLAQAAPRRAAADSALSRGERVTRLLIEGRAAYKDGDMDRARARFEEVIKLDSNNSEARNYLRDIGQRSDSRRFIPTMNYREMPAGLTGTNLPEDLRRVAAAAPQSAPPAPADAAAAPDAATEAAPAPAEAAPAQAITAPANQQVMGSAEREVGLNSATAMGSAEKRTVVIKLPKAEQDMKPAATEEKPAAAETAPTPAQDDKPAPAVAEAKQEEARTETAAAKPEAEKPAELEPTKETAADVKSDAPASPAVGAVLALPGKVAAAAEKAEEAMKEVAAAAEVRMPSRRGGVQILAPASPTATESNMVKKDEPKSETAKAETEASKKDEPVKAAEAPKEEAKSDVKSEEAKPEAVETAKSAPTDTSAAEASKPESAKAEETKSETETAEAEPPAPDLSSIREDAVEVADEKVSKPAAAPAGDILGIAAALKASDAEKKTVASAPAAAAARPTTDAGASAPAPKADAPAATEPRTSSDPRVAADELLRQAQRELREGNRTKALATAQRAAETDPKNVEAVKLAEELSGRRTVAQSAPAAAPAAPSQTEQLPPIGSSAGNSAVLADARSSRDSGRVAEAEARFEAAISTDPSNLTARAELADLRGQVAQQRHVADASSAAQRNTQAEANFQKGLVAYESGRLDVAVQYWNKAVELDSRHPRAVDYLQRTRGEYDAWVQQHQYNAVTIQREASGIDKLDTPITYDSAGPKTITEFMSAMSLVSDIRFYITEGVDPQVSVNARFDGIPLHEALDIVLLPIGLKWSRSADVVTVTPDLRNKVFNLTHDQVVRMKLLLENKTVQRILYGPEGIAPMRNVELLLDDRENILIVTDSEENIQKVAAFLKDLQIEGPQVLTFKNFKIRAADGPKIKALVEALVKVQSDAPYDLERKVVVEGDDLIVKDTAENLAKVEALLLDKNLLRNIETAKLDVGTYNLTPREPLGDNLQQARDLAENVVTVVKTILYSQSTESAASAEGRRLWYDPNTLQLTVTDYPENLQLVGNYIRSLPIYGRTTRSEIIMLKHQTAATMQDLLQRVLGLAADLSGGTQAGNSITKTLRVEGELVFRDLRIRVVRINENDANDRNDDSVDLVVRTPTTSEDRTIQEYRSEFIDNYEINVIDVRPSGTPGEGSARIQVLYNPAASGAIVGQIAPAAPGQTIDPLTGLPVVDPTAAATSDTDLVIETIENMNALLIRYSDPGDFAELKSWLDQLDIPVLQVSIETKLVEVNENRAKEWAPEWSVSDLRNALDFGNAQYTSRFGRLADEFRDGGDPAIEMVQNAPFMKGTQVFNVAAGSLNFTLRTLEAEGVLNIVNGPVVTVENGETADFEIEKRFGLTATTTDGTQGTGVQSINQVQLSVTPQITMIGEIRLEIQDLELQDLGNPIPSRTGGRRFDFIGYDLLGNQAIADDGTQFVDGANATGPAMVGRTIDDYDVRRRSLQTVARVKDGGTIVLGGWTGETSRNSDAGVPILRNLPYVGKLFFNRTQDRIDKTSLLIFLTCHLQQP